MGHDELHAVFLREGDRCAFEGCEAAAIEIVAGRGAFGHPDPSPYCLAHGRTVSEEDHPEYVEDCPNCGCRFGVN